jgi:hypothetical protein
MKVVYDVALVLLLLALCSCTRDCSEEQAYDKLLSLNRIQSRFAASGPGVGHASAAALGLETGAISELIAAGKLGEACKAADALAKKLGADLEKEKKGTVSYTDLTKDVGKGSGECSIADAAQKQMMLHGSIQERVDAGELNSDVFKSFGDDLAKMGELMSTNPSEFCKKLNELEKKYLGR